MLREILCPEGDISFKSAAELYEGRIIYCRDTIIRPYFRFEAVFVAAERESPVFEFCYGAISLDRAIDLRTNEDILKDIEISEEDGS